MKNHIASLGRGSAGNVYRLALASVLALGLVETSSAASCALTDVTIDSMNATDCGSTPGALNDDVGGGTGQPETWSVNVNNDGPDELLWNAYYRANIIEDPPDSFGGQDNEWSLADQPDDDVANGQPIDLLFTGFSDTSGDGGDPLSEGTFTLNALSPSGDLLVVLKDGADNNNLYHWYYFENKIGSDLVGTFNTINIFDGANLSHLTVYEIGVVPDGGGPPQLVPVPAAVWLFGSGLLGLVGVARRRKHQ